MFTPWKIKIHIIKQVVGHSDTYLNEKNLNSFTAALKLNRICSRG